MSIPFINSPYRIGLPLHANPQKIEVYESPLLAYDASAGQQVTWNHNFGFFLTDIEVEAVVLTTALGFQAGEVIHLNGASVGYTATIAQNYGFSISSDENNIYLQGGAQASYLIAAQKTGTLGGFNVFSSGQVAFRFRGKRITTGDIVTPLTTVDVKRLETKIVNNGDADVQFNLAQYFNEYESFVLEWEDVRSVTDGVNVNLRTSSDGISFDNGVSDYSFSGLYDNNGTASATNSTGDASSLSFGGTGAGTNEVFDGSMNILKASNPNSYTILHSALSGIDDLGVDILSFSRTARTTQAQTKAIQIFSASGNLDQGTFILYGKRRAT